MQVYEDQMRIKRSMEEKIQREVEQRESEKSDKEKESKEKKMRKIKKGVFGAKWE